MFWQLGRHREAIRDYEHVVRICEESGASDGALGSAKSELGFALVRSRTTRDRGLRLLEEGVMLAETGGPDGFLVRAKRKLGYGYLRARSPRRAMTALVDAHDIAVDQSMFDQISGSERLAKGLDRWAPFLKSTS